MATMTAGIVLWRRAQGARSPSSAETIEILVVHPGGPFWAKKDEHAWSIPKGEFDPETETALDAARREFEEETGTPAPLGPFAELDSFRAGKKHLHAFAIEGDFDHATISADDEHRSMVELEWPPRSGRRQRFPEVDRESWVPLSTASDKLHKGQRPVVDQLIGLLLD